jgi:hypothetical protein
MMSDRTGWYEGSTFVLRKTYLHKDAQDRAEFEELMSGLIAANVAEEVDMVVEDMVVDYHVECVQVTVRVDHPDRLMRPIFVRRNAPWQR